MFTRLVVEEFVAEGDEQAWAMLRVWDPGNADEYELTDVWTEGPPL